MKKLIVMLSMLGSLSAFAEESSNRKEVQVLSFEETSIGALVKVEFYTYCDDSLAPFCIGNGDKIKKETSCELRDGYLVANVRVTHRQSTLGGSLDRKRKNVKIRMNGLCQGRTPDRLIVNSHQIL